MHLSKQKNSAHPPRLSRFQHRLNPLIPLPNKIQQNSRSIQIRTNKLIYFSRPSPHFSRLSNRNLTSLKNNSSRRDKFQLSFKIKLHNRPNQLLFPLFTKFGLPISIRFNLFLLIRVLLYRRDDNYRQLIKEFAFTNMQSIVLANIQSSLIFPYSFRNMLVG